MYDIHLLYDKLVLFFIAELVALKNRPIALKEKKISGCYILP